jgi:type IV secretion system protein VirD4
MVRITGINDHFCNVLCTFLTLYRDPVIANNIRESDFAISDLMNLKNPVSLYFTIPVSDAERFRDCAIK